MIDTKRRSYSKSSPNKWQLGAFAQRFKFKIEPFYFLKWNIFLESDIFFYLVSKGHQDTKKIILIEGALHSYFETCSKFIILSQKVVQLEYWENFSRESFNKGSQQIREETDDNCLKHKCQCKTNELIGRRWKNIRKNV